MDSRYKEKTHSFCPLRAQQTVWVLIASCNIMKVNKQLPLHSVVFGDEVQGQGLLLLLYSGIHIGSGAVRDTQGLHRLTLLQTWQQAQSHVDLLLVHLVYKPRPSSLAKTDRGFLAYLLFSLIQNILVEEALLNSNEKKFFLISSFLYLCPLCSQGKYNPPIKYNPPLREV